ncbi:alpha/beta hydrolase [Nocardia sp. NBC_00565]|uniref:alpha/beta fold hydrolase n=1 Tax=Nocardia sp. NBC_00565 TaxID=2975993 RepID=UPI002E806F2F|nr:hypothetical protein [Nocardia sp. NBC_00565]WUC00615.1 alpha/beta hydrolase [Nocardia sp. NBC_00565]
MNTIYTADFRDELRAITLPTLVIHGDADASAPIDLCGRVVADLIPGNTYKEYPAIGHGIMISHAARLNADILDFIKA